MITNFLSLHSFLNQFKKKIIFNLYNYLKINKMIQILRNR